MNITTVLPVSRTKYLDRVLKSLQNQTYKPNNLLVIFDGEDKDFVGVRNKIVGLDYESVLCVKSNNYKLAFNIPDRRLNIVEIHKQFQQLIGDADWVFSIEDDGILSADALEKLAKLAKNDVGMVTGVELGRWGTRYVGAWRANDVHNASELVSMQNKCPDGGVEEIDACGLYCALIRADEYKKHAFTTQNGLGPDVNLGLFLRRQGYHNYIDWSIPVTHLNLFNGQEIEISPLGESRVVKLKLLHGRVWQSYK